MHGICKDEAHAGWVTSKHKQRVLAMFVHLYSCLMLPEYHRVVLHLPIILLKATRNEFFSPESSVLAGGRCGAAQHWGARMLLAPGRDILACAIRSPCSVTFTTFKLFGLKFSFARCLPPAEFSRKLQGGWERGRAGGFPKQD